MEWIISANSNYYDHESSFLNNGYIDWKQNNYNYAIGDFIYIYCTNPIKKIRYLTRVEKTDMTIEDITDDEVYWINKELYREATQGTYMRLRLISYMDSENLSLQMLKSKGLKAAPQGAMKLDLDKKELSEYLRENFLTEYARSHDNIAILIEGKKHTRESTHYERNPIARQKCLDYYGYNCQVCKMNFEDTYGKIGKNFIHVHHCVPLSHRNTEYQVDYLRDLIPVCPNCHAMLHRKKGDDFFSISELKELMK